MKRRKITLQKEIPNLKGLIACGDLHIQSNTPRLRTEKDFFEEVCVPKLEWLIDLSNSYEWDILVAGDIFDTASVRHRIVNRVIEIFQKCKQIIYAVPGQHDMHFHSQDLINTPFQTLVKAGAIVNVDRTVRNGIVGCGFESDYTIHRGKLLLTHFCVTEKEPPFFLTEALSAKDFLKAHKHFKIVVSGDYHVPHVTVTKEQMLINCGAFTRRKKDQINHKPCVYLVQPDKLEYKQVFLPFKSIDDAFNLERIEKEKETGIQIDTAKLTELVKKTESIQNYEEVVYAVCDAAEQNGVDVPHKRIKNILNGQY